MEEIINIPVNITIPSRDRVYELIEIYDKNKVLEEIKNILSGSLIEYEKFTVPCGLIKEISILEFETIFKGEGNNKSENPISKIYQKAENIALFAVTLGINIDKRIKDLFTENLYPEGYMLDAVASCGTEQAAEYVETHYTTGLINKGISDDTKLAVRYSPGYCGWDITGQKKLFEVLKPEQIGISLNDRCLMTPMKSISGVIISGEKSIHYFVNDYDFCVECKDQSCKKRLSELGLN
jgi:hypothetical protein